MEGVLCPTINAEAQKLCRQWYRGVAEIAYAQAWESEAPGLEFNFYLEAAWSWTFPSPHAEVSGPLNDLQL